MSQYSPDESSYSKTLKDSIVVISGGATGIGAATVKILSNSGAKVVVGDVNAEAAEALCEEHSGVRFVRTDVTKYEDIYNLFKKAYDEFGRVDHAVSCAGIFESGNWFDPKLSIETVKDDSGNLSTLNVNVLGTLYLARVAAPFLREGRQQGQDKSLTLLSSVNAFRESPGLYIYQLGKHAVQGILRSSRKILYERDGIRVNAVCPGVTDTPMTSNVISAFRDAGLYWQPPAAVGKVIAGIQSDSSIKGKAYYIEGGDAWEFEDTFYNFQPQWLGMSPADPYYIPLDSAASRAYMYTDGPAGEESTRRMRVNADAVQKGALTPKE